VLISRPRTSWLAGPGSGSPLDFPVPDLSTGENSPAPHEGVDLVLSPLRGGHTQLLPRTRAKKIIKLPWNAKALGSERLERNEWEDIQYILDMYLY
jgi:hypothetical protein